MYSRELQKLTKRGINMYDLIYNVLSLIDLRNKEKVARTITNLEHLFEEIIPNVYFCRQLGTTITWIVRSADRGEYCRIIIEGDTFEII